MTKKSLLYTIRPLLALAISVLLLLTLTTNCLAKKATPEAAFNEDRNRLIALMLSRQFPAQHFSHQPLDDTLSRKAFDLYLRQLDPRKRFLLQADVKQLNAFATHIDDELTRGRIVLADAGMDVLNDRIRQIEKLIDPILDRGFDFETKEYLEIEPKKVDFAENIEKLRERWRLSLKMQVLDSYFDALNAKRKQQSDGDLKDISIEHHDTELKEAVKKVRQSTHRALNRLLQQSRQDHFDRYFDAVARAFDPHSDYMAPASKEDFDIQMSGSLEGIGAVLREDEGLIKVISIIPGSAAEKQGQLQAGDTILAVAEKNGELTDISEMRIREAVSYIRGPKGTAVRLTVQKPDGSKRTIQIIRDVVQIEETYVKSSVLKAEKNKTIGYLRIPSFYRDFAAQNDGKSSRNVTDDTLAELIKLKKQKINGLILDLRNNGGGALTDAVKISGLFLPGGPVVQVKDAQGTIKVLEDDDPDVAYDGPVIILVNQFSASASEILAAALQDYKRAFIIGGEHTHGKGTVQAMMDMNKNLPLLQLQKYDDLGALKLTIQKFYRINGGSTQYKGVEPDLVVPSMFDYLESGEKFMDYSLPWDQVQNVYYTKWRGASFDANKVKQDGKQWAEDNALFKKIKEQTSKAKARSEQTLLAVFLEGMWQYRQDLDATRKEALAAGLIQEEADEETKLPRKSKKLEETLATDPFVQIALYLMKDAVKTEASVGLSQ